MGAVRLEAWLANHDGDRPVRRSKRQIEDDIRDKISDLTPFDVRTHRKRRPANLSKRLWVAALALVALFILFVIPLIWHGPIAGSSDPSDTPVADSPGAATSAQSSDPSNASPGPDGSITGTWDMYWTNPNGVENVGFILRFLDDEYGTLEAPYDDLVHDGTYDVDGDQISFGFARDFEVPSGIMTEWSAFEGTLVGPDEIRGKWFRDDWECWPEPNAGCKTAEDLIGQPSRLVRRP